MQVARNILGSSEQAQAIIKCSYNGCVDCSVIQAFYAMPCQEIDAGRKSKDETCCYRIIRSPTLMKYTPRAPDTCRYEKAHKPMFRKLKATLYYHLYKPHIPFPESDTHTRSLTRRSLQLLLYSNLASHQLAYPIVQPHYARLHYVLAQHQLPDHHSS